MSLKDALILIKMEQLGISKEEATKIVGDEDRKAEAEARQAIINITRKTERR